MPSKFRVWTSGLRHSCISYALAANPEHGVALVSQWAGNSEATIRKHYRRLLKPDQGKAWFAIGAGTIIQLEGDKIRSDQAYFDWKALDKQLEPG